MEADDRRDGQRDDRPEDQNRKRTGAREEGTGARKEGTRPPAAGTVYALLVGIDAYLPTVAKNPLKGCLNDIEAARRWLEDRIGARLALRVLPDGQATVAAVREAVTGHLGQAGPGDTALFWFSGHGTRFAARGPGELMKEGTGDCQAVVCADGPLADVELGPLLEAVAARGAHTTAVMDCCYSGGTTRDDEPGPTARFLPPDPAWRLPGPASRAAVAAGPVPHAAGFVTLAASTVLQVASEDELGGSIRGFFSHALLGVLATVGPTATSREVLAAAHCRVQLLTAFQHPVLLPHDAGGLADRPFLGGASREPSRQLLRHGREGWEVDLGSMHGLSSRVDERPADDGAAAFVVTADGPESGTRRVVVREVLPDRALVTPADWEPDPARVYPVALSALALPPARVVVDAPREPAAEGWVHAALAAAGPGGGPTPLLRAGAAADPREPEPLIRFRLAVRDGRADVIRRDGTVALAGLPLAGPGDAADAVDRLIHLTRWHQLHGLHDGGSPLHSRVHVEVSDWYGTPTDGVPQPHPPYGIGEQVFRYGGGPGAWREPMVSVRIHNRSNRPLWCVLLDLTDRYAADPGLYEPAFIGPGCTGYALNGDAVHLRLPPDRPVRPGASARDWLKLIVAENEFNTVPLQLQRLEPGAGRDRLGRAAADGMFRLAAPADHHRDAGRARPAWAGQWATRTLALRTVVPAASG